MERATPPGAQPMLSSFTVGKGPRAAPSSAGRPTPGPGCQPGCHAAGRGGCPNAPLPPPLKPPTRYGAEATGTLQVAGPGRGVACWVPVAARREAEVTFVGAGLGDGCGVGLGVGVGPGLSAGSGPEVTAT